MLQITKLYFVSVISVLLMVEHHEAIVCFIDNEVTLNVPSVSYVHTKLLQIRGRISRISEGVCAVVGLRRHEYESRNFSNNKFRLYVLEKTIYHI